MGKIINISSASFIALHSLAYISSCNKIISIQKISDAINMPESHVAKIVQMLVKFNYLKSSRGPKGGIIQLKSPSAVTLLEIFELVEGSFQTDFCPSDCADCPFKSCIFGGLPLRMSLEFKEYLKNKTLEQFINEND
jgi:Rrf2 family transcriptional regulator, nitric oxide-sensitive transcriptional repressor